MLLNLTDVLTSEGKTRSEEIAVEMTAFESRMGHFPITEKTPLRLTLSNVGEGKAELCGYMALTQLMNCDRCLKEVPVQITLDFTRIAAVTDGTDSDESDVELINGCQVNIESLVYNELLMNQPEKVLCKPDCKGICKKCGKDLNEGDCGCDTFVPDPRMAVLQDIFNANKEV